ncbi:MAG: hypothetical protein ACI4CS_01550 [Candidatus Weimeria sp.]
MSQAKVEEHKEEKLHRKEIVKRQKRNKFIAALVSAVICAAAVVWIGWSLYGKVKSAQEKAEANKETVVTPIDLSAISDYSGSIVDNNN